MTEKVCEGWYNLNGVKSYIEYVDGIWWVYQNDEWDILDLDAIVSLQPA